MGYVLGGVLLTNWMDKLSAVSLFLFALKLTFLQGRAARSTVSSHLPLSHRHYKQTMQVCQKALYIKHSSDTSTEVRQCNGHPYNYHTHHMAHIKRSWHLCSLRKHNVSGLSLLFFQAASPSFFFMPSFFGEDICLRQGWASLETWRPLTLSATVAMERSRNGADKS